MKKFFKLLIFFLLLLSFDKPVFANAYLDIYEELFVEVNEVNNSLTIKNNSENSVIYWKSKDLFDDKIVKFMPGDSKTFDKTLPELREENYKICRKQQQEFNFEEAALIKDSLDFRNKYQNYEKACWFDGEILKSDNINIDIHSETSENKSYLKDYVQINHIKNNSNKKLFAITANNSLEQIMQKHKQQDLTMLKSREIMVVLSFTGIGMWLYAPVWICDEIVSVPVNYIKDLKARKNENELPDSVEIVELPQEEKITIKSVGSYIHFYDPDDKLIYSIDTRKYNILK